MRAGRLRHRVAIQRKAAMPSANAAGDLYINGSETYQYDGSMWGSVSLSTLVAAINAYSGGSEFTTYVGPEPALSADSRTFDLTGATVDGVSYHHPGGKYYEGADGLLHASAENEWPLEYRDGVAVGRTVRSAEHWYVTLQTADGDTLITATGDTLTN